MTWCRKPKEYCIPIILYFKDLSLILKSHLQQITIACPLLLFEVSFLYVIINIFLFDAIAKNNNPLNLSNNLQ